MHKVVITKDHLKKSPHKSVISSGHSAPAAKTIPQSAVNVTAAQHPRRTEEVGARGGRWVQAELRSRIL